MTTYILYKTWSKQYTSKKQILDDANLIIEKGNKLIVEVKVTEKLVGGDEKILINETRRAKLKTQKL